MNLPFGRKRYRERQRAVPHNERVVMQHRLGLKFGIWMFDNAFPKPTLEPSSDPLESAFRCGVAAGWESAEWQWQDEVCSCAAEVAEREAPGLVAEVENWLARPWPSDDGPVRPYDGDA